MTPWRTTSSTTGIRVSTARPARVGDPGLVHHAGGDLADAGEDGDLPNATISSDEQADQGLHGPARVLHGGDGAGQAKDELGTAGRLGETGAGFGRS